MKGLLILLLCISGSLALTTCDGNCGINDNTGSGCQCNSLCSDYDDCCDDYDSICMSCENRCSEEYLYSRPCHCNDDCPDHSNCCSDYFTVCDGVTGSPGLTDQDIIDFSEELYNLDVNSVGHLITVDTTPPGPLFTSVDPSVYDGPTISTLVDLRDNYDVDSAVVESDDATEAAEKVAFLDAVFATDVMNATEGFMWENNLIPTSRSLREVVDEIFFTYYTRAGGPLGSNGFEHSFLGEIDDNQVKGYHNWISWSIDESEEEIAYLEYLGFTDVGDDVDLMMMGFEWTVAPGETYPKPISSMWIGSSPELELALYTVCFFYKPNSLCDVSNNGVAYRIQTYTQASNGLTLVGSAYPDII